MKRILITMFVFGTMFVSGLVYAQPSITPTTGLSGVYDDGEPCTVRGVNFGFKSPAAPKFWNTFEDGTPGQVLATTAPDIGAFHSTQGTEVYSSVNAYNGSQCAYWDKTPEYFGDAFMMDLEGPNQVQYINGNVSISPTSAIAAANLKFMRINPAKNETTQECDVPGYIYGCPNIQVGNERGSTSFWIRVNAAERPGCIVQVDGTSYPGSDNEWINCEMAGIVGTPDQSDGYAYIKVGPHRQEYFNIRTMCDLADVDPSWCEGYYVGWILAYMSNEGEPNIYLRWDNMYGDNTLARVVLGDASTWAACTKFDPQPPTSWSSTEIGFTFNKGSYTAGDVAYVYVVDEDGLHNDDGYAITIGGVAEPPVGQPGQPQNVTAEEN